MEQELLAKSDILLARIPRMHMRALERLHRSVLGEAATVRHLVYLRRKLAWAVQARGGGGLAEETRQHAFDIACQSTLRTRPQRSSGVRHPGPWAGRDPRLPPPGTLLRRVFQGKLVVVKVLPHGFAYQERVFSSLSTLATQVTGTHWNGYVFFGLAQGSGHGR